MIRDITIHWGIFLAFWDGMKILPVGIGCLGEQPNWNQHCVLLQVSDTCHLPCLFCAPWNVASAPRMCSLKVAITCSYPFYGFLWQFLLAQYIYDHLVPLLVTSTWYGPQMWDPKWTDLLWRSFQLCDFFGPCWTSQKWKTFHLPLYHPKKQMIPNHESNWSKIATSIHEYPLVLFKIISQPPQVFDDWKNITRVASFAATGIRIGHGHSQAGQVWISTPSLFQGGSTDKRCGFYPATICKSIQTWGI